MIVLRDDGVRLGGKARALGIAARAGLPVPEWFVVSPEAAALAPEAREQGWTEVGDALAALCPNGELVAVRSSAMEEDGAACTFAGQFESFLSVGHDEVRDRIARVWESALNDRVQRYRRQHGLPQTTLAPAVLVQKMVAAEASGVAFSADPVTGRRDLVVVAATRGLGMALVSGEVDGDTYHVDREGAIVTRGAASAAAAIDDGQVQTVAALARRAESVFGCPQDIEWAIESGRVYLLQSRPITTLGRAAAPDGVLRIWDNSNIIESYSGVTTPLTFSFAREAYEGVYRQFCRLMRVRGAVIASNDDLFGSMLGLVRGRVYYNLLNWYRLLALLPGFRVNRRFMEQMMGVAHPLTSDADVRVTRRARVGDALRLAWTMTGLAINYATLGRRQAAFRVRLDAALMAPVPPLAEQGIDRIAAGYRDLRGRLLTKWDAPIVNDFFAMIFYGALRDLAVRWCRDDHGSLQNDLLAGEGGMISTEPARRIRTLAAIAAPHVHFVDLLLRGSTKTITAAAALVPGFEREYEDYLVRFGERCADELKLESATLVDDPLPLLRAIGQLARATRNGASRERTDAADVRAKAEQRASAALAGHPFRRAVFAWVLANARRRVRDRENLRFERTRLFGRIRRIFLEMGRRLHERGVLDDPRDVFSLQVDEVLAYVDGRAVTADLKPLVAVRRAEFARYASEPAPAARFETRGPVYDLGMPRNDDRPGVPAGTGSEQRGIGCCPGILRGPVRVVRDPSAVSLEPGSILVAERTDPGWIMIFPSAAGLLVERGSLLSHSAIVARELGIPAIVSVPGLTSWLKDGDWVEMDGSTGLVRKVAA